MYKNIDVYRDNIIPRIVSGGLHELGVALLALISGERIS